LSFSAFVLIVPQRGVCAPEILKKLAFGDSLTSSNSQRIPVKQKTQNIILNWYV